MSLTDVRTALEAALAELNIRPVQELDTMPNVSGSAMAAIVEWGGANYLTTFTDQSNDATFRVVVLAGRASERAARLKLDALVDPSPNSTTSLRNTLNGDLGDTVGFAQVATASEYRNYPLGAAPNIVEYLGCEFTVVIGT
jgi:hypothetical protein